MNYIVGRKDGVKRRVSYLPKTFDDPKTRVPSSPDHVRVLLELEPGHLVVQTVNDSRIQTEGQGNESIFSTVQNTG